MNDIICFKNPALKYILQDLDTKGYQCSQQGDPTDRPFCQLPGRLARGLFQKAPQRHQDQNVQQIIFQDGKAMVAEGGPVGFTGTLLKSGS